MDFKKIVLALLAALLFFSPAALATARTELTPFQMADLHADAAPAESGLKLTRAAGDASNGNQWKHHGGDVLIAKNGGGSSYTLTLHSVKDASGRTSDLVLTLAAADEIVLPVPAGGYKQADGEIYVDVQNVAVTLAVLRSK